jgi:hypothetical protein
MWCDSNAKAGRIAKNKDSRPLSHVHSSDNNAIEHYSCAGPGAAFIMTSARAPHLSIRSLTHEYAISQDSPSAVPRHPLGNLELKKIPEPCIFPTVPTLIDSECPS